MLCEGNANCIIRKHILYVKISRTLPILFFADIFWADMGTDIPDIFGSIISTENYKHDPLLMF